MKTESEPDYSTAAELGNRKNKSADEAEQREAADAESVIKTCKKRLDEKLQTDQLTICNELMTLQIKR